jgi:hypothetical protein
MAGDGDMYVGHGASDAGTTSLGAEVDTPRVNQSTNTSSIGTFANGHLGRVNGVTNPSETSRLIALAQTITRETEILDRYLKENDLPYPNFDVEGPSDFPRLPDDISRARHEVVRATTELRDLTVGPTETLRWMAWDVSLPPPGQRPLGVHRRPVLVWRSFLC